MILVKDNNDITEYANHPIVRELLDRELRDLERDNFLIFPPSINESTDLENDNTIFSSGNRRVRTGNIVGILKKGKDEIRIHSRFYDSEFDHEDYFLKYLLQKVSRLNIVRTTVNIDSNQEFYNLLVYLFPMYFNSAMQKGVYKEYVKKQYNDANIKGSINVARHIKINTPFLGKFSYDTREFNYDNRVTQLIRHTIEKIQLDYNIDFQSIDDTKENIRLIIQATPTYSRLNRIEVLQDNILNPVRHGYFEEYSILQQLCIQILNEEKIGFGDDDDEVHGIIIDVAWLWEEYLNTIIEKDFIHPENKNSKYGISLFSDRKLTVYPDFYSMDKKVVLDAKYKMLDSSKKGMSREDRYQIISYLHVLKSDKAGIAYPSKNSRKAISVGLLNGFGGELFKLPLLVPQNMDSYELFVNKISETEIIFSDTLENEINSK